MSLWRWVGVGAGTALLAGLVIAYVAGVRLSPLELRQFDAAAARQAASAYSVEITRDQWGVPRIIGARDADTAFGLAFAHAEDDFATIQTSLRAALGPDMLARSESEARSAWLVQALGVRELVDRAYGRDLSDNTRAMLEAYAAGLNYYAALHPDARASDLFPVTGEDVAALSALYTPLFYGMSRVLTELLAPGQARDISRGQEIQVHLLHESEHGELGSNAFAVAPSRSDDGATRLIVNSHQPVEGPLAWYEAHLISGEGLEFAGGLFPGGTFLNLGANPDLAHAATVNTPDLIDVYTLELDETGQRYAMDGEWRDLETRQARLLVHVWGPIAFEVRRPIHFSVHGPAFLTPGGAKAVRHVTQSDLRFVEATNQMMRTRSVEAFEAVLREFALASTNRIVADRNGRIARYYNARMPVRPDVDDIVWRREVPGDRSDLVWQDFEPFNALPHMIDPASGYVLEANHSPFVVTGTDDDPDPADYPARFGIETLMTNRALRAVELMAAMETISRDGLLAVKFDDAYHADSLALQLRGQLLARDWSGEPELAEALDIIARWDGRASLDNREAALSLMTYQPIGTALFVGAAPPDLADSFRAAVDTLLTHHGRLDPLWSEVNRLMRGDADVALAGGPDTLRAVNSSPDGNGRLRMVSGDGLTLLVEWDADGRQRVEAVHQFGSSSNPQSPHYTDQMALFAEQGWREIPMGEAAVRAAAVETYRPGARSQ